MKNLVACFSLVVVCLAGVAQASFMAADLVYVPAAVNDDGVEGSVWLTELTITNVDDAAVDVALYIFPGALLDNNEYLAREYGIGGRAEEGYGFIDESLADIPPGGTVVLNDPIGAHWLECIGTRASLGAIAVFAYEAGSLDDLTTFPDGPVPRNVIVTARIYNTTTIVLPDPDDEDATIEQEATYAQIIPGVPWYNLADGGFPDISSEILIGAGEDDTFRFNMGMVNTSDPQTSITLVIEPIQANGEQFIDENEVPIVRFVTMPPLSFVQYNRILSNTFGLEDVSGISVQVSMVGWTTTSPNPVPTFTIYGSMIDDRSNDPYTLLPSFTVPYDIECVWSSDDGSASAKTAGDWTVGETAPSRISRVRPLSVP